MAEEQLKKVHLFGKDLLVKGSGAAAGGIGGNGMAITGGGYVGPDGGITTTNRWLRFDFNDPNHKSLVILGGTSFTIGENIVTIDETTSYNLSDYISEEGADYYVFINAEGRVIASPIRTPAEGYMFIGQFHTLCNGVPANQTAIMYSPVGTTVGTTVVLKNYFKNQDLDFANFYTRTIDAVYNVGSYYCRATVLHVLQGFNTMDILPESVWCLNFHPDCKNWDGMVYCNSSKIAVDIYLQSSISFDSESSFGNVVTINRLYTNYLQDSLDVGKKLPDFNEFRNISMGHPQQLSLGSNPSVAGGNSKNDLRFISFIGCEDCCGVFEQSCGNSISYMDGQNGSCIDGNSIFFGLGFDRFNSYRFGGAYSWGAGHSGLSAIDASGTYIGYNTESDMNLCANRSCCDISIV